MSSRMQSAALALLMLTISLARTASAGENRPDPANPNAAVPEHRYVSAFTSYRKPEFEQKLDWRQANDTVRDVGGHGGALKGVYEQSATPAPSKPAMNHGGHGGHGGHRQ
jgi:hypothetical protein